MKHLSSSGSLSRFSSNGHFCSVDVPLAASPPPRGAGEEGFKWLLQNILKENNLPSAVEDSPLKVERGSSCGQKACRRPRALCCLPGLALSTAISERAEQFPSPVPDGEKMAPQPASSSLLLRSRCPAWSPPPLPSSGKGTQSFKVQPGEPPCHPIHLHGKPREGICTSSLLQVPCTDSLPSTPGIPCGSSSIWHLSELNSLSCSIEGFKEKV